MKTYVTFGLDHRHEINGKVFDKDCVAVIVGENATVNREKAFELFGPRFSFEYPEAFFNEDMMSYFPRGYVYVEDDDELL